MDTKLLIKNLHDVFCENNKTGKKYKEVWLTPLDLGGLYSSDKFILCLKAEHEIDSCYEETAAIINLLKEKTPKESEFVWRVMIYNMDEQVHCESYDLKVYDEQTTC